MTDARKLAIVPAYNEEASVGAVVSAIQARAPGFDVLVVDDGSTDGTGVEAERSSAAVIHHPFRLGIGGAVQSGFKYALRNGYGIAAQVDGDGQHDPAYLPALLEAMRTEGVDIVCGSRFCQEPGYDVPLRRRAGIKIFALIVSRIVRQRITDPTSGFRMANARAIELFAREYPHDYPEVEAILLMHANRLRLHEIPVPMRARLAGHSSITNTLSAYYMVKVLLAVLVGLFRRRPVAAAASATVTAERAR